MVSYPKTFTTEDFTDDTESGKKKMTITAETLDMGGGMNIRLSKLLRNVGGGKYENVIAAYDVDTSGNLHIYSDAAFNGKLLICNDV
jgi:hypothetical protein